MQKNYIQLNPNAGKSMNSYQNQDANAIAIDSMLLNLKTLLKKMLLMKKLVKQFSEKKMQFQQNQLDQKISYIDTQTKNLPLVFDKTIPPDKRYISLQTRMTNLFYMRMIKQIASYQKIIPSFGEIRPKLQQSYSQQVSSENFSIVELYLLCERKFIMQIKLLKNKILEMLKDQQNTNLMMKQDSLKQSLIDKNDLMARIGEQTGENNKDGICHLYKISTVNQSLSHNQRFPNLQKPLKKAIQKCYKTLADAIQNASKSQLYLDFKQRTTQITQNLYSPLDIQSVQIIAYFIPTLMPQDNIDFIYQKVKTRSKKTRKQFRDFQTEYALFILRKQENNRRKLRKEESRKMNKLLAREQKVPLKIAFKGSVEVEQERLKLIEARKSSLPSVQILKPISIKENTPQRGQTVSRFRQRFQQSLQHPIQSSLLIKLNTINPQLINKQKSVLPVNSKQDKVFDQSATSLKENSCIQQLNPLKKGISINRTKKTQIKVSKFGQKRGRSLKNMSNKEIVSKKLKL